MRYICRKDGIVLEETWRWERKIVAEAGVYSLRAIGFGFNLNRVVFGGSGDAICGKLEGEVAGILEELVCVEMRSCSRW